MTQWRAFVRCPCSLLVTPPAPKLLHRTRPRSGLYCTYTSANLRPCCLSGKGATLSLCNNTVGLGGWLSHALAPCMSISSSRKSFCETVSICTPPSNKQTQFSAVSLFFKSFYRPDYIDTCNVRSTNPQPRFQHTCFG